MQSKMDAALTWAERLSCRCLICGAPFQRDHAGLVCRHGHTVNANRKGYLNFLSRPVSGVYDQVLFEARGRILDAGFYDEVLTIISEHLPENARILDGGTGNGFYLKSLLSGSPGRTGAGIDISRDAIERAADSSALWLVADLRRLPFPDQSFDAVLSILSPADYSEFRRILKPDGELIKVVPGPDYLREIRTARNLPDHEDLSGEHLARLTHISSTRQVKREIPLTADRWRDFVFMTPMNQDLSTEEKETLARQPCFCITIDLMIYISNFEHPQE